jgi:hypothetical protein
MAASDGVGVDRPVVLAGADGLDGFAADFRRVWDAQTAVISGLETADPFGYGPSREAITGWYLSASASLRRSGPPIPGFCEGLAGQCRKSADTQLHNNEVLAQQQARQTQTQV